LIQTSVPPDTFCKVSPIKEVNERREARDVTVALKRKNLLIILAALIIVVAIIDYFLYLDVTRNKRLSQEKRHLKVDLEEKQVSESTVVEAPRQLEEGEESKADGVASNDTNPPEVGQGNGQKTEQGSGSPTMPSVSEMTEKPEAEVQNAETEPQLLQASSVEDAEPNQVSETPAEVSPRPIDEETPTMASIETEPVSARRTFIQRPAIALAVENREPKGISKRVSVLHQKVYCWLRVINGKGGDVTVRWFTEGPGPFVAYLPVGSDDWRTWSYLTLTPRMIGPARVEILRDGELLETLFFEITE
jgi:hypothetical protein